MSDCKWGICLDEDTYRLGLFQEVVQYILEDINDRVVIVSPKPITLEGKMKIKELQVSPRFHYGEEVIPEKHPDVSGII